MYMSSSTVMMVAKSIPPIAAPITAGYMLLRGSAATHHSYTLLNIHNIHFAFSLCFTFLEWFSTHVCVHSCFVVTFPTSELKRDCINDTGVENHWLKLTCHLTYKPSYNLNNRLANCSRLKEFKRSSTQVEFGKGQEQRKV